MATHNIVVAAHIHLNHLHILCTLCYEQLHLLTGTHSFIRNSLLPSISSTGSLCFFHRIMLINLVCSYCIFDAVMYIQTSSLIRSLQTWCDQRFINKYYNNQTWWAKQIMHNIRNICIWLFYDCNILPQHICIVGHYIIFCAVVAGVVVNPIHCLMCTMSVEINANNLLLKFIICEYTRCITDVICEARRFGWCWYNLRECECVCCANLDHKRAE